MPKCRKCQAEVEARPRCPACGAWGTVSRWTSLKDVQTDLPPLRKWVTGWEKLDELVGGAWVSKSIYRLSGEPGCGKSTLCTMMASKEKTLYLSCEEEMEAVAARAKRLDLDVSKTLIGTIESAEELVNLPSGLSLIIVDSLNKLRSKDVGGEPGSNLQLIKAAAVLRHVAAKNDVTILAIAHVNADGEASGARQVEHDIDVTLHMTSDCLSVGKNRHGPSRKSLPFLMTEKGISFDE